MHKIEENIQVGDDFFKNKKYNEKFEIINGISKNKTEKF